MIERRGKIIVRTNNFIDALDFKPGDVVYSVIVPDITFTGVVVSVDSKTKKIFVNWGSDSISQHDLGELMISRIPKTASRRMRSNVEDLVDDEFII